MKLHRRLIVLVGLGMLLVVAITLSALQEMTMVFLRTTGEVERLSVQFQRVWDIENRITEMHVAVRGIMAAGEQRYGKSYIAARDAVHESFREMSRLTMTDREMKILGSIMEDFREMQQRSERIVALARTPGTDRTLLANLLLDLDSLHLWMRKDIGAYKDENAALTRSIMGQLRRDKVKVGLLFIVILLTSVGFLLVFGYYLYRKVSVPLNELWLGAGAISSGNLDHRIPVREESDIGQLSARFNEMAQRLQRSHEEIETKLLARTRHLAALNSVALALSRGGSLPDVLHASLLLVLENLADLEPRGGVFLCDPEGKSLTLSAHVGFPQEFAEQEASIGMGECLCGTVARTGEIIYTEQGCRDARHTRSPQSDDADRAHIIVPLKARGAVLGVMFLYPRKAVALKQSDIQLLDSIGGQLGMAIENLRLYGEVKASSEKYWDLFENSRDIMCIVDRDGQFQVVNRAAEQLIGAAAGELPGRSMFTFLGPESAAVVRSALRDESVDRGKTFEVEVIKKGGDRAILEVSARRLFRDRTHIGYQVLARDVTEQKHLRQMLLEAERLAAICQLGIAVRHEINNPLTTIIGNAELLLEEHEHISGECRKRLAAVLDNALRIAEIVKQLEGIRKDRVVEYLAGIKMTDLKQK